MIAIPAVRIAVLIIECTRVRRREILHAQLLIVVCVCEVEKITLTDRNLTPPVIRIIQPD